MGFIGQFVYTSCNVSVMEGVENNAISYCEDLVYWPIM